ncbi:WhiB family transcriptional regulator [Cellulomonas sp. NPDC089187]|uniref:WhiB family transcriptional regulator n=1 Tax=Cellulomonas sp. NPDC089187 TaxID=3154970 RepID=UPI00342A7437
MIPQRQSRDAVEPWQHHGACVGRSPALFEPDDRGTPLPDAWDLARRICAGCPVREICLADALDPERRADFGMRGGLTPAERRAMRMA